MRILLVSTTSLTAHTFLLPLAQYLREHGHEVSFACSPESFGDAPSRVSEIRSAGFLLHEIPFSRKIRPIDDLRALWKLKRLIQAQNYDLVHTQTSKAGYIGRFAATMAKCPVVVHTAYDFFFRAYESGLRRRVFMWLEKIAAPFCDVILFISEAVREESLRCQIKEADSSIYVGHGIDVGRFKEFRADRSRVRAHYGIDKGDLLIGNVGRLVHNKGIDTFLRAAALVSRKYPHTQFIIGGDGPLRNKLEILATTLGIGARTQFVGHLTETEDVMKLMLSLDIFVLPTRREGLGVVYLEAMALQCPVVGSRISPVTEVVKDGKTGVLAAVDDPEAFAEAIFLLIENSDLTKRMGTEGVIHVEREFDQEKVFQRIENVYEKQQAIKRKDQRAASGFARQDARAFSSPKEKV
jgi:glycosyltransferase involved in cell wall biosynthesis